MKKKFLLFFLIFFCNFSLVYSDQKFAPSVCYNFLNKVIDNYNLIKDHRPINNTIEKFGITIESIWDPTIEKVDEYNDDKISYGSTIYKRDKFKNIFIGSINGKIKDDYELIPGSKILEINGLKTKNLSDDEISDIFDVKSTGIELTFENFSKKKIKNYIKATKINVTEKYLDFKIHNFNNLNNQNFSAEFLLTYSVRTEMWDNVNLETDDDDLFKISKESFYYNNEGKKGFESCGYNEDEINRMQLYSPLSTVSLLNSSYINKNTSNIETTIEVFEKDINQSYSSIDFMSTFKGLSKIDNDFDLKTFPFDKQKIVFQFVELANIDVELTIPDNVYSNLHDLINKDKLINGWDFIDYQIQGVNYSESGFYKGMYTDGVNIILELERQSAYYIYKVILPIILILMVCWSAIWITPLEIESRLTITIVCLLSLIAYNFVIDSELPKLEYLTIMDWIIFVSYIFAAIPNFLCVVGFNLYKSNKKLSKKIDDYSKFIGPISYLIIILSIIIITVNTQPETSSQLLKAIAGK